MPAILGQLEQQPQQAEVLISVCHALKNLANKDRLALEQIAMRNGFDVIFNGTQAHKENVELLKTALDVLSLLRAAPREGDGDDKAEAEAESDEVEPSEVCSSACHVICAVHAMP